MFGEIRTSGAVTLNIGYHRTHLFRSEKCTALRGQYFWFLLITGVLFCDDDEGDDVDDVLTLAHLPEI